MRICFDLDGVICELRRPGQTYSELNPVQGAAEKIAALRSAGHEIIIATARHMKTCDHSIGKVVARQGKTTLDWLEKHRIQYDEIWFGKPHCDVYIDDNGLRFVSMKDINDDGSNLPIASEKIK